MSDADFKATTPLLRSENRSDSDYGSSRDERIRDCSNISTPGSINVDVRDVTRNGSSLSVSLSSPAPIAGRQSSVTTVFVLWNTMMGTSMLTMPWAIEQAGLATGLVVVLLMMGLCFYTAYRVVNLPCLLGVDVTRIEYADLCRTLLGVVAEWTSVFFSVLSLVGAVVVYWVLMSNFLFHIITFVYDKTTNSTWDVIGNLSSYSDVLCPEPVPRHINSSLEAVSDDYKKLDRIWNLKTTPLFLLVFVVPLINFKSVSIFAKLNALGLVSVLVIVSFVFLKASKWGINVDFSDKNQPNYMPMFRENFPALVGTLSLAFFIHNCVTSIMKHQKHPENNVRDLFVAYVLVCMTYVTVGVVFYISFPLNKLCLEDNLLNNLYNSDTATFVARLFLFVQMLSVLPLVMFLIRTQMLHQLMPHTQYKLKHILLINSVLIIIALLFAVYYPHISFLIRYTGSVCGLVYTFTLPCLTYMVALKRMGKLNTSIVCLHSCIIVLGVINLISQFFVTQRF